MRPISPTLQQEDRRRVWVFNTLWYRMSKSKIECRLSGALGKSFLDFSSILVKSPVWDLGIPQNSVRKELLLGILRVGTFGFSKSIENTFLTILWSFVTCGKLRRPIGQRPFKCVTALFTKDNLKFVLITCRNCVHMCDSAFFKLFQSTFRHSIHTFAFEETYPKKFDLIFPVGDLQISDTKLRSRTSIIFVTFSDLYY